MSKKVIRFVTFNPCTITWEEYAQIQRDVIARRLAGCSEVGDRVLARLLLENESRYNAIATGAAL